MAYDSPDDGSWNYGDPPTDDYSWLLDLFGNGSGGGGGGPMGPPSPTQGDDGIQPGGGVDNMSPADWTKIFGGGSLDGGGGGLSALMKFLGMTGMGGIGGTGISLGDIFGAGAGLWGTMNKNDATKESTKMLQDAAKESQAQVRDIIGGAAKNFQPFIDTGTKANADLYNMVGKNNLADLYRPKDVAAASKGIPTFKPIKGLTLADLAKTKR